jgi:hypothetical protein
MLFQAPFTLVGHTGCSIYEWQATGCHRVSCASFGLISRSFQFVRLRRWPRRLVFANTTSDETEGEETSRPDLYYPSICLDHNKCLLFSWSRRSRLLWNMKILYCICKSKTFYPTDATHLAGVVHCPKLVFGMFLVWIFQGASCSGWELSWFCPGLQDLFPSHTYIQLHITWDADGHGN